MSFLWRCLGKLKRKETDEEEFYPDNLCSEVTRRNTERGEWFARAFSTASYEIRGITIESLFLDDNQNIIAGNFATVHQHATLTPNGVFPRAITIKSTTEQAKGLSANMFMILETVPVCKECDSDFNDVNEVLFHLVSDKVQQQQSGGFCCTICKSDFGEEESVRVHLLQHIESGEIICEECEIDSKDRKSSGAILYEKNLEKVKLAQILFTCKLCNNVMVNEPISLSETLTIKHSSESEETSKCRECNCDLLENKETFTFTSILCDSCTNTILQTKSEIWKEESELSLSELSGSSISMGNPRVLPRRCINLSNKEVPFFLQVDDFLIREETADTKQTWFTCRFCGESSTDGQAILSHCVNHISITRAICDQCQNSVCGY